MIQIQCEADIPGSADTIFATLADLRSYDRWLTRSAAYPGTTDISDDPVAAGTTYIEAGPRGVRHGTVTEFQPPTRVTFHQPMTMKPRLLGIIDITVSYTLTVAADSVHVDRVVTLTIPWPLKVIQASVLRQFRTESERTLAALKALAQHMP